MTGNNAPSGVGTATCNSYNTYGSYNAFNAFDRVDGGTTGWCAGYNVKPAYVAFKFPTAQVAQIIGIYFNAIGSLSTTTAKFTVQGSNDDWTTPIDLTEELSVIPNTDGALQVFPLTKNVGSYLSYRVYFTSYTTIDGSNMMPMKIQLYA